MPKPKKETVFIVNLPGIDISSLKEIQGFIIRDYNLATSWSIIAVISVILVQIAYNSNPKLKHHEYMTSESVSLYVRKFLANTVWSRTIYALLAIRKTLGYYEIQTDPQAEKDRLNADLYDLINNPSGVAATRGGIRAALTSPERARKYRRGLMLQAAGTLCNRPLSSPSSVLSKENADKITLEAILNLCPFDVISPDEIRKVFKEAVLNDNQESIEFVDNFQLTLPDNLTSLEKELDISISRQSFKVSPSELAVDKDALDDFQKLIFNAKKNLS